MLTINFCAIQARTLKVFIQAKGRVVNVICVIVNVVDIVVVGNIVIAAIDITQARSRSRGSCFQSEVVWDSLYQCIVFHNRVIVSSLVVE